MRQTVTPYKVLDAASTTNQGTIDSNAFFVKDFRHKELFLDVVGQDNASDEITIKFVGSKQEAMPDFGAAQSATNNWDYIEAKTDQADVQVAGSTGVTVTNANSKLGYRINNDGLHWFGAKVTTYTDASEATKITLILSLYND